MRLILCLCTIYYIYIYIYIYIYTYILSLTFIIIHYTVVIHHIHCIEAGVLVIGYLNFSSYHDPSLLLARLASTPGGSSVGYVCEMIQDLKDPVCTCEVMEAPYHRYYTQFIEAW